MKKATFAVLLCAGGLSAFWACQNETNDTAANANAWQAPEWADTLHNPIRAASPELKDGETLYNTYCGTCHGPLGAGDGTMGAEFEVKPANFHLPEFQKQTDGAIFWKISEGKGAMPAFKASLGDDERWQLVAYLRKLYDVKNEVKPDGAVNTYLPVADFAIDPALHSAYIPLPTEVRTAIQSEELVFMADTVITGLERPWGMAFLPDNRILITEREGKLLQVKDGKLQPNPIGGDVPTGLRDIKLHPQYDTNKLIYLTYYIEPTETDGGYTVLMRGRLEGDRLVNGEELYRAGPFQEGGETFGSRITFDPAGFLYMTVGQRTIDERHRWLTVQDKTNPSGKVLRFHDDGSIPKDNPFVDSTGALPEIWTLGHRQPQGLSTDPKTGDIWETEHGEMGGSELNHLTHGGNFGWPLVTFSRNYDGTLISQDTAREGMVSPAAHYIPSIAPSGFDFVYGSMYPGWDGDVFIGAMIQGRLSRTVLQNGVSVHDERLLENIGRIRDVKVGPDQFLYLVVENKREKNTGRVVRLIPLQEK